MFIKNQSESQKMYIRSLDLSQDRDAAKKPTYRVLSQTEQPTSSGVKLCRLKAADIILMSTKLMKRDTAFNGFIRFF